MELVGHKHDSRSLPGSDNTVIAEIIAIDYKYLKKKQNYLKMVK